MINPFIKVTGCVDCVEIIINILKISSMRTLEEKELHPTGNAVIHTTEQASGYVCKETSEEIMSMIQKYYDNCMLADFASNAMLAHTDEWIEKGAAIKNARVMLHQFRQETK